jgi:hypothetical protein
VTDQIAERLTAIGAQIAVVGEFAKKAAKATAAADHDAVIELEQAGDSAKAAAEADSGLSEASRQAVLDAHLAICKFKFKESQA